MTPHVDLVVLDTVTGALECNVVSCKHTIITVAAECVTCGATECDHFTPSHSQITFHCAPTHFQVDYKHYYFSRLPGSPLKREIL